MPCAAHLHAPQAQLHVRRAFREVAEVQDSVREELLLERRELAMVPGRDLGDQEARRVEGLQEPEEVEELAARVVQAAQAVQGCEAVDRDEVERVHAYPLVDVLLEDVERAGWRYKGVVGRLSEMEAACPMGRAILH